MDAPLARDLDGAAQAARLPTTQRSRILGIWLCREGEGDGTWLDEIEHAEVTIYVPLPAGVSAKQLAVDVGTRSLSVGLKGKPPYLKGALCGVVYDDDAIWTVDNGFVKLELTKAATSAADNAAWHGALTLPSGWACEWHQ